MTGGKDFKAGEILHGSEMIALVAEWRLVEDTNLKETKLVRFINGFPTTKLKGRWSWRKHGRQGAFQKAYLHLKD